MSEVYLQFDHPKLVNGSANEKEIINNFFNCAYSVAMLQDCRQKAFEAYMEATSVCIEYLELEEDYSLSLRLYDNCDEAVAWFSSLDYPEDDNIYSATTAIYTHNHDLRCDSLLMFLGIACNKEKIDYMKEEQLRIDWNAYCCVITEF